MKIGSYTRATEDETGKLPEAVRLKTDSQDAQIDELTLAAQGLLNFQDNFPSKVIEYECTNSETVRLSVKALKSKPTRLILDWTSHFSPWDFAWRVIDAQTIEVIVQWTDPPTGRAKARVTVFSD